LQSLTRVDSSVGTFGAEITEPRDPAAAYRVCGDLTRRASKTFHLASLFLDADRRHAVWAVYAVCRTADDLVDCDAPAEERLAQLADLEKRLQAAHRGIGDDPIFVAWHDASRRFAVPLAPALALIRGARMDVTVDRYPTYAALREYCDLVAATVGHLVMPILGARAPESAPYATALGRAMQLTNILRDVGEDAAMGRVYLPLADLRRFGYSVSDLFGSVVDERFRELMRFEIRRARRLYDQAQPGIALLEPRSRYTVRLALHLYRRILERIERNDYDVFSRRAHVPLHGKLGTALALAFAK